VPAREVWRAEALQINSGIGGFAADSLPPTRGTNYPGLDNDKDAPKFDDKKLHKPRRRGERG
jgi:hypothetical protein